ncbi:MAG: SPOR domain-containing protein [Magnetococcales bacterium]|nr:SPOR domain-containing protein [Magnetococcales bacterium]
MKNSISQVITLMGLAVTLSTATAATEPAQAAASEPSLAIPGHEPNSRVFSVEVGTFKSQARADGLVQQLRGKGFSPSALVIKDQKDRDWYVVSLALFSDRAAAKLAANDFAKREGGKPLVRTLDRQRVVTFLERGRQNVAVTSAPASAPTPDTATPAATVTIPVTSEPVTPASAESLTAASAINQSNHRIFSVEVGTFGSQARADSRIQYLRSKGFSPYTLIIKDHKDRAWHVVCLALFTNRAEAHVAANEFARHEGGKPLVRTLDGQQFLAFLDRTRQHNSPAVAQQQVAAVVPVTVVAQQPASVAQPVTVAQPAASVTPEASSAAGQNKVFSVEVGTFAAKADADRRIQQLRDKGMFPYTLIIKDQKDHAWHVVCLSLFTDGAAARAAADEFASRDGSKPLVRALDSQDFVKFLDRTRTAPAVATTQPPQRPLSSPAHQHTRIAHNQIVMNVNGGVAR